MANALKIARLFHDTYEQLAPQYGYETRKDTKKFDPNSSNGKLMIAVCDKIASIIEKEAFESGFRAGLLENNRGV